MEANFERRAIARPCTALDACSLLTWERLGQLLESNRNVDGLVVARGANRDRPTPRSLETLRRYLSEEVGLVIRHAERYDVALRELAGNISSRMGETHIQIFVTPSQSFGFSWHYDDENVFIVQTCGVKDYYFKKNTVTPDVPASSAAFTKLRHESSPLMSARLSAGDVLYIPARWWHVAVCAETSLSLSIGVPAKHGPFCTVR